MTSGSEIISHTSVTVEGVCDHVVETDCARPRLTTAVSGEKLSFGFGVDSWLWRVLRFVGEAFTGEASSGGGKLVG